MATKNNTITEDREQEILFKWLTLKRLPAFAIPNGGHRNAGEAAHMKRCGVRAGVPDIFLPVPSGGFHGLFIELKRVKGGKVSEYQEAWLRALTDLGYKAEVCKGWQAAVETVEEYLRE